MVNCPDAEEFYVRIKRTSDNMNQEVELMVNRVSTEGE